jgi:hypothetical protein
VDLPYTYLGADHRAGSNYRCGAQRRAWTAAAGRGVGGRVDGGVEWTDDRADGD